MYDLRIQVTLKKKGEKPKTKTFKKYDAQRIAELLTKILDEEAEREKDKARFEPDIKLKTWRSGHRFRKFKEDEEKEYYRCRRCNAEASFLKSFNDFQRQLTLGFHSMRNCAEWMNSTIKKVMNS